MMDLRGQIMNIQCRDGDALNAEFSDRRIAFKTGHKEARHAAAELALGVEAQIAAAVAAERERWRKAARAAVFAGAQGVWSVDLAIALRDLAAVHDAD